MQFWGNRRLTRWFVPGLGVKRWLLLMLTGLAMLGLGIGYIQVQVYRQADVPEVFYYLLVQLFLPVTFLHHNLKFVCQVHQL